MTETWRPVALSAHWSASGHGYTMIITEAVTNEKMTLETLVARYNVLAAEKLTAAFEAKVAVDAAADKAAHPERWPQESDAAALAAQPARAETVSGK